MMFLRCELFDITKAARRLVNFVELMYDLYGDIGLQRRTRLDDLSEYELEMLKAGSFQFLPKRDHAERRIYLQFAQNSTTESAKSRLRILLYLNQQCPEADIETQRKGYVFFECVSVDLYVYLFLSHFHFLLLELYII